MYPYLAFPSCDLYFKVVLDDAMEDTYELDRLIPVTPGSASILDILTAASGKDSSAEAREAVGEVISAERKLHVCKDLTDVGQSISQGGFGVF